MTNEEIAELRTLEAQATKAPWADAGPHPSVIGDARLIIETETPHDAALIAAMRNALPDLLDDIDRLSAINREQRLADWNAGWAASSFDHEFYAPKPIEMLRKADLAAFAASIDAEGT